jgi:hypothetical protein
MKMSMIRASLVLDPVPLFFIVQVSAYGFLGTPKAFALLNKVVSRWVELVRSGCLLLKHKNGLYPTATVSYCTAGNHFRAGIIVLQDEITCMDSMIKLHWTWCSQKRWARWHLPMLVILMFTSCAGHLCFMGWGWRGPLANQQQGKGDWT